MHKKKHAQQPNEGIGAINMLGLQSLAFRTSVVLSALVLFSIGLIAAVGYVEISSSSQKTAKFRLDLISRVSVSLLTQTSTSPFRTQYDSEGHPRSLRIANTRKSDAFRPDSKKIGQLRTLASAIEGTARLFKWTSSHTTFTTVATSLAGPPGNQMMSGSITSGHPAYTALLAGQPYLGKMPVDGHQRLAFLIPVLTDEGELLGAVEADAGWVDDLAETEQRHHMRIVAAAILIIASFVLLAGLYLRFELYPIRQLARNADNLANGNQPERIPYCDRRDEIGDLAHGLERVTVLQDKLHKLAYTDPVTTAGNRTRYFSDLNKLMQQARNGDSCGSLVHLDFKGFAKINDTFGHHVGNRVLILAYARLARVFGPAAKISRISGDDFCILLPDDEDGNAAEECAKRAVAALTTPFNITEGEIRVEPSIGIALLPRDAQDAENAHRVAGLALRAAKDLSGSRYVFFSAPLNERVQTEMLTETLLRSALKTKLLALHYQPQICPVSHKLIGLEALVRWPSEKRGFIPPSEFVPIAEKSTLILELGHYVLELACAQIAHWISMGFDFGHVSVNVSPQQFRQPRFAKDVKTVLETYNIPPSALCLEVTENVFLDTNEQQVLDILSKLQKIGVQLSLDDFGSGYSSLIYLHRLPFQELKIDRAFIQQVEGKPQNTQLFQAIVGLGHSLGLRVIAEGAETEDELALATANGCSAVQGFVFSPALPAEQLEDRLAMIQTKRKKRAV